MVSLCVFIAPLHYSFCFYLWSRVISKQPWITSSTTARNSAANSKRPSLLVFLPLTAGGPTNYASGCGYLDDEARTETVNSTPPGMVGSPADLRRAGWPSRPAPLTDAPISSDYALTNSTSSHTALKTIETTEASDPRMKSTLEKAT
jgi:hypothetical protein